MTMSEVEREVPEGAYPRTRLSAAVLTPADPRFVDWLVARQRLMDAKGWQADGDEFDAYDTNEHTTQVVLFDSSDTLVFGMRLTPIESYDQTLSWDMVQGSSVHEQARTSGLIEAGQLVWDLTRLAPGDDIPYSIKHQAIPRLFGEGLKQCQAAGDSDPLWVFTLDDAMTTWLRKQDVGITVLGQAILGDDEQSSSFGFIKPAELAALASTPPDGTRASSFAHRAMRGEQ